jgi:hypothetical protein
VVDNSSGLLRDEAEIDGSENAPSFDCPKVGFHELTRIEKQDCNLVSLSQTQLKEGTRKLIGPSIEFLIGQPVILKDKGGPVRKFTCGKAQDLTDIHPPTSFQ